MYLLGTIITIFGEVSFHSTTGYLRSLLVVVANIREIILQHISQNDKTLR